MQIATERKTRLGRHVESSPAQRPVPIADWLREQEELDSSGAERASESPRARALLASIRGPLSPNQTSDSYVQRLERMLVSLRGELEGRGGEGGVRNVQEEGEGDVGNVAEMDRTDGVFRAAKVGSPKRQTGQEGIGEALKERTKNGGELGEGSAAKESRRGDVSDAEASTENSPRPRWKLPYKTVIRKDESLEREPPSEKTKRIVKDTAQRHDQTASSVHVETRSGEEQPPDEAADLATGEAREEELRSAWPELSVREQDYRRALGIAPGWDSKAPKRASEVEERENDSGGLENEVDARTKLSGSTGRRGSRNGQTEGAPGTRRKKDTEKGAYEEGRSGERRGTFDTARETSGSESSAREKERGSERRERRDVERGVEHTEKKRAAWKTGGWEHVAGPGMRGGPEGDVTADVEIGDERGGSIGKSRKKNSERTGGEASVWKTSGGKKRGPYRGQADDSRSSASDVSSSGEDESPRWAERSRAHGGAERLYDSSAYDDDAEEVLRPNYYSDGEADQRTAYTMDRRAAYGTESAPLQRPKSARTVGRLWQEDSPRASEGGASERSFSGGYGRATYSGGVERVTFPGGVKGPCQLATEHSCHRNCVRYLGVPRGATVPQPFGFDERERLRGRSIAEKRTAQVGFQGLQGTLESLN